MTGSRTFLSLIAFTLSLLAMPASAQAADAYVDFETGDDAPPCGPINDPCKTIQTGITNAGTGDTVHVDDTPGQYASGFSATALLGDGKSLIGEDFVGGDENGGAEPDTVVQAADAISANPAIRVSSAAGTISGLRILGGAGGAAGIPIALDATATVTNSFIEDSNGNISNCLVTVANMGNNSAIGPGNAITDPTPAPTSPTHGICVSGAGPTIESNTFTGTDTGVFQTSGGSQITDNVFTGMSGTIANAAIDVTAGVASMYDNLISNPANSNVRGIKLEQTGAPVIGAYTRRNVILGHSIGVVINDTHSTIEFDGDLIAGNLNAGIASNDSDDDGDTFYSVTNATIADNGGQNISVNGAELTLDSSIVSGLGITTSGINPTCEITFSRGPTTTPGVGNCGGFQTTAAPGFVNAGAGDYHLTLGSPMIDMGDPDPPLSSARDLDGDLRALDGNGDGLVRRDIGADEFPTVVPAPINPLVPRKAKKKCKKKRKKRAASAKKCKRKKKR